MKGSSEAFGAVSIVNAIAGGKGTTLSVDLRTRATVDLREGKGDWEVFIGPRRSGSRLARESVMQALAAAGKSPRGFHGSVRTESSIPMGVGLKSSSSSSVAIALATMAALGDDPFDVETVLACSVKASLRTGVSITGALDDAASCLLGGVNMCDNQGMRLIASRGLKKRMRVIIKIPDDRSRRRSMNLERVRRFGRAADQLFRMSLGGAYWEAMTLNGIMYSMILGYGTDYSERAIELGARGAGLSGTGPSVAAVLDPEADGTAKELRAEWGAGDGTVIETTSNNSRGRTIAPS